MFNVELNFQKNIVFSAITKRSYLNYYKLLKAKTACVQKKLDMGLNDYGIEEQSENK